MLEAVTLATDTGNGTLYDGSREGAELMRTCSDSVRFSFETTDAIYTFCATIEG